MDTEQNISIDTIIRRHVIFSMIAGTIPVPIVDIAAITAIQIDLIKDLARAYEVDFSEERGKAVATALIGTTVGNIIGRAGASLVKAIPGVGTLLGIGSMAVLAGASTYALGKVFDYHFREGGNLSDFDVDKMKQMFRDFFESGKKVVKEMRSKPSKEEIFGTIEKLKELKEDGTITEEEFERTKAGLLNKLKNL